MRFIRDCFQRVAWFWLPAPVGRVCYPTPRRAFQIHVKRPSAVIVVERCSIDTVATFNSTAADGAGAPDKTTAAKAANISI